MELKSLNDALNTITKKIKYYLDNPVTIEFAPYEKQQNVKFISDKYNEIVEDYSNLLYLIEDAQYFISQCKKLLRLLSNNTALEISQKDKIKTAITIVEESLVPIFTEKERLKTIEMMYRAIYNQKDF